MDQTSATRGPGPMSACQTVDQNGPPVGDRVVDEVEHGLAEVCAIHAYLCVFYERDDIY